MDGFTPDLDAEEHLFGGVIHGSPEQYEELLSSLEDVNVKNTSQRTLLHIAVRLGKFDWVERLLGMGADPFVRDRGDATALDVAKAMEAKYPVDEGRKDILKVLLFVWERETAKGGLGKGVEGGTLGGESCIDPKPSIELILKEVLTTVSALSREITSINVATEKLTQVMALRQDALSHHVKHEVNSQKDALVEYFSREMMLQKENLSQSYLSVKGSIEELRTLLAEAIDDVKVGLTSRDTLLEKLEVSITSLVEEWAPLKEFLGDTSAQGKGAGKVSDESPSGNVPDCFNDEDGTRCVEEMMRKTELLRRKEGYVSLVRSFYERIYSSSHLTSCILRHLRSQPEFQIVVDCESKNIGKIKRKFKDFSGRERGGEYSNALADFKEKVVYLAGMVDSSRTVEWVVGHFAMSLARMSVFLAFGNDGRPYSGGDEGLCSRYRKALEEAKESWFVEDDFDYGIINWVHSKSQLEKEACAIGAVPGVIAYFGADDGALRAQRKMRSLARFYEEHVVPKLLTDEGKC